MPKIGCIDSTETFQFQPIKERFLKPKEQARSRAQERDKPRKNRVGEIAHVLSRGDGDRAKPPDKTRVVLLPVDPYVIHAYWAMLPDDLENTKRLLGKDYERAKAILRFHDITCLVFNGSNAHSFVDVPIDLRAPNWYVRLWSPEKSYCADLGLRTEDGGFFPLARSNVAEIPRACASARREACYMLVEGDYKHVEQISDGEGPTTDQHRIQTEETRSLKLSREGDSFVDLTDMNERGFVSWFSSTLFYPLTGKTGG